MRIAKNQATRTSLENCDKKISGKNCYRVIHKTYLSLWNTSIKYHGVKDLSPFL